MRVLRGNVMLLKQHSDDSQKEMLLEVQDKVLEILRKDTDTSEYMHTLVAGSPE